jgi:hypothetical protein
VRVASLYVLALFLGGDAGYGDTIGGSDTINGGDTICGGNTIGSRDAGWDGSTCGDGEVAAGVTETPALAGLGVLSSSVEWV